MVCPYFRRGVRVDDFGAGYLAGAAAAGLSPAEIVGILGVPLARSTVESYALNPRRPSDIKNRNSLRRKLKHVRSVRNRVKRVKAMVTKTQTITATRVFKAPGRPSTAPGWVRPTYEKKKKIIQSKFGSPAAVCRQLGQVSASGPSVATVRRDLQSNIAGHPLKCYRRPTRTELSPEHMAKRVTFCRRMIRLGMQHAARIVFSDEKWFDSNDHGTPYQWCPTRRRVRPRTGVQAPPKVFIWACIGVGFKKLVILHFGEEKALAHPQYIRDCLNPVKQRLKACERIFMQDGAGCHDAARGWLAATGIRVLDWPALSADLNPLENLWALLSRAVSRRGPWSVEQLETFVREEWEKIEQGVVDKYVLSFLQRCEACVAQSGANTGL